MKLSTAFEMYDRARVGEVADSTRRWFYWCNPATGERGGRLWSLVEVLGDIEVTKITIHELRHWRASLLERDSRWHGSRVRSTESGGLSQDGFRNYIRAVKQFFKWLHEEKVLESNPAARLPVPPPSTDEPKAIDVDDARRILDTALTFNLRDMAFLRLHQDTGARVGELDRLTCDGLDMHNRLAVITRYVRKGRYTPRSLPFSAETAVCLDAWRRKRPSVTAPSETDHVFTGRLGNFPLCLKGGIAFGVRNYAIAQTMASSAARAGGVAALRVRDLQLEDGLATVWEKGRGNYLKSRFIFLDDEAVAALYSWIAVHPDPRPDNALFVGLYGPLTRDGVYQVMTTLANEAGVDTNTNPHAWRHAWSIEALRDGADIPTVAKVLGNKPATVMQSYARWAPNQVQERHRQYNWKQRPKE